ncbi:MAG: TolC family protein [Betaproteobacteria bacterium]|nr:TolC family protein [Betaproteobacteria bacterium]
MTPSKLALALLLLFSVGVRAADEPPRLSLTEVARLALGAGGEAALERARLAEQRAQGALLTAQGAFDWNLTLNGGVRRVVLPVASAGLLTTGAEYADIQTATVGGGKLYENGIRIQPGMQISSGAGQSRLEQALLDSRPTLALSVPLDASWGEPAEALRRNALRSSLEAARLDGGHTRQAYLHRVMKSAWSLLAAQQRYAAVLGQAAIAQEVAGRTLRLAAAKEIPQLAADDVLERVRIQRLGVDQADQALHGARLDLALLLGAEESRVAGVQADFPAPVEALDAAAVRRLAEDALSRRLDLQGEARRVDAARQFARSAEREAGAALTLQVGHDRLLLNWEKPLGENRDKGAREQAQAQIGLAALQQDEARRTIERDVLLARRRLLDAAPVIPRTRKAVERLHERLGLTRQLAQAGQEPFTALLDAAAHWANAELQRIDLELVHAHALADLHLATASVPEGISDPALLARTYASLP